MLAELPAEAGSGFHGHLVCREVAAGHLGRQIGLHAPRLATNIKHRGSEGGLAAQVPRPATSGSDGIAELEAADHLVDALYE
jgi:hypothetical protein